MNAPADVVLQVARIPQHTTSLPTYLCSWLVFMLPSSTINITHQLLRRFVSVMFSVIDDDTVHHNPRISEAKKCIPEHSTREIRNIQRESSL